MEKDLRDNSTQNSNPQTSETKVLTYEDVLNYLLSKQEDRLTQEGKELNVCNNFRTAANKWVEYAPWLNEDAPPDAPIRSASLTDPVGDELGIDFEKRLAEHLLQLERQGFAPSTIASRKNLLIAFQQSWVELVKANELPEDFKGALKFLMEREGVSQEQVARRCGLYSSTLSRWVDGSRLPRVSTLKYVTTIEKILGVQSGTLVLRLPSKLWGSKSTVPKTKNTPFRAHLAAMQEKPYRLKFDDFTDEQKREWETLKKFYTDSLWFAAHGFDRHGVGWRTRRNNNKNSTAEMKLADIQNFYGFLILPSSPTDQSLRGVEFDPENKSHVGVPGFDPHLTGLGLDPKNLSLALFTDAGLVNEMLNFLRRRSFNNYHNTHTKVFLAFCAQLTRPEKGFLYQFPEYGERLQQPTLNKEEWEKRCREAHKRITRITSLIKNNRDQSERFNLTRDTTVEIVKPLIKEREHPISVLVDIAEGLRRDFRRAGNQDDKAELFRNMVMVRIVTSNPMRAVNIAEMRFMPGAKGHEHEPTNLYKLPDGSYRLKYEEHELKNGATRGRYDLPVNGDLTADLDEYFAVWRPLLVGADACHYVFRPSPLFLSGRLSDTSTVSDAMSENGLSNIMRCASQTYLVPECAGFGLHSARHFVATEYLKFNPGAYEIPATALHDSEEMVRDTYSWVTPDDKIVFWNNHLSFVLRELRKEAA